MKTTKKIDQKIKTMKLVKIYLICLMKLQLLPISLNFFSFFFEIFPYWIRIQEGKLMRIWIHSLASHPQNTQKHFLPPHHNETSNSFLMTFRFWNVAVKLS